MNEGSFWSLGNGKKTDPRNRAVTQASQAPFQALSTQTAGVYVGGVLAGSAGQVT